MSSIGLNKWIVSGHLAADAEIKTVELKSGEKANVAKGTIFVRKPRTRDQSFTVSLNIWEGSSAWRRLPYLKKGSLIICTGSVEVSPYMSKSDNRPRAGLAMNVLDIDLDNVRNGAEADNPQQSVESETSPQAVAAPATQKQTTPKATAKTAPTAHPPQDSPPPGEKAPATAATATKATQNRTAQKVAANSQTAATAAQSRTTQKIAASPEGTYTVEK